VSVYTLINRAELDIFLADYPLGELIAYVGIAEGVENSNYALTTTSGEFILTLFEQFAAPQIGYFLQLLTDLRHANFLCPQPELDKQKQMLKLLAGKPAVIFQRLAGRSVMEPSVQQCRELGKQLAKLHEYGQNYPSFQPTDTLLGWCCRSYKKLQPHLSEIINRLIATELDFQSHHPHKDLPQGLIHGDLFRDNVLFSGENLTGLLDFYNASRDALLLDVAITANDWCVVAGQMQPEKLNAAVTSNCALLPTLSNNCGRSCLDLAHCDFGSRVWNYRYLPEQAMSPFPKTRWCISRYYSNTKQLILFSKLTVRHRLCPLQSI
jgi:homoserine kinase type II